MENHQGSLPPHVFRDISTLRGDTLALTREDFDNPEVHNASNPHPVFGYAHGPVPNNNPYWLPQVVIDAMNAGRSKPDVKVSDIQHAPNPPANPMVVVNRVNGLICDVLLPQSNVMCGSSFEAPNSLRRHQRKFHHGAIIPAVRTYTHTYAEEKVAAENALKKWVLYGGWRNANYLHEPGRGPVSSPINGWCEALERIALQDSDFRARFGATFHRGTVHLMGALGTPGTQNTSAMEET